MTNATLKGKLDAGNQHVRFDRGKVASVKPRRRSLPYGLRSVFAVVSLSAALAVSAETSTGTSAPIAAETIGPSGVRSLSPTDLGYDPSWAVHTNLTGGKVVISLVQHPDTDYATTNQVVELGEGQAGTYSFSLPAASESVVRLLHRTELDGQAFGETLAADVSFGKVSSASTSFFAASATNALQRIADAKGVAPLAYSTDWTNGVSSIRIDYAYEQWKRGQHYGSGGGTLFSAAADATGVYDYNTSGLIGGDYTLTYTMLGANDEVLGTYTALFALPVKLGTILVIK